MGKYPIKRGYQKWEKHNIDVFKERSQYFLNGVVKPQLVRALQDTAREIVELIDGDNNIPIYTGNLHDATGVGVYVDGMLSYYIPAKIAQRKQSSGLEGYVSEDDEQSRYNWYGIDGTEFLQSAMEDATTEFNSGCWIVLFSAVPYAFKINERTNFFGTTAKEMAESVLLGLEPLNPDEMPTINNPYV